VVVCLGGEVAVDPGAAVATATSVLVAAADEGM